MFGKATIENLNARLRENREFQCLKKNEWRFPKVEKPKSRLPMFRQANIKNSNVWKSGKREFQYLENHKSRIPWFRKVKIGNSNIWKSVNRKF